MSFWHFLYSCEKRNVNEAVYFKEKYLITCIKNGQLYVVLWWKNLLRSIYIHLYICEDIREHCHNVAMCPLANINNNGGNSKPLLNERYLFCVFCEIWMKLVSAAERRRNSRKRLPYEFIIIGKLAFEHHFMIDFRPLLLLLLHFSTDFERFCLDTLEFSVWIN